MERNRRGVLDAAAFPRLHEVDSRRHETSSWSTKPGEEALLVLFSRLVTDVRLYKVQDMDPLSSYVRRRAVIIGDVAHSMTPFQGQGVNQAIEDAGGLNLL